MELKKNPEMNNRRKSPSSSAGRMEVRGGIIRVQ
jgi:hypothetical protein